MRDARPLRVLFVCLGDFHAPPGARQIYAFARALADAGHPVRILVGGDPATVAELGENVDDRVEIGTYRFGLVGVAPETLRAAAAFRPDVVHLYEPRHAPASAALAIVRRTGARLFVRVADNDRFIEETAGRPTLTWRLAKLALKTTGWATPRLWPFTHPRSYRPLIREARGLDAITPALARETERRTRRPCRPILPAVPAKQPPAPRDGIRSEIGAAPEARLLLYAGSVYRPQFPDFALLLRAFALLAADRDDVWLLHTGRMADRYGSAVLEELAGAGAGRIRLLGFLPTEQDVLALMRACDVLVQPGAPTDFNRLRFPAKLHDYLVSGRPVVSYAAGVEEIVTDGEHGLLTHGGTPEELAGAIARVLDDPALAERLGAGGRRRALEVFAPERARDELMAYYRS